MPDEVTNQCWCKKFLVPECCDRYLEDPKGKLVHTKAICYQVEQGPTASCSVVTILPGPVGAKAFEVAKAFRTEFEMKPLDVSMSYKVEPA